MRVVVVEQDYLQREHLHAVCKNTSGIERVDSFGSTKAAAEFLAKERVELVIVDLDWTPLDGILLARQICGNGSNTALVFLAAEKKYCYDALQLDAEGYLLKPYLDSEISVLINKVIHHTSVIME